MSDLEQARVVAQVDQVKAQLDDLVKAVREHRAKCEIPQVRACIGVSAMAALYGNPKVFALLCVALVELADVDDDPRHVIELRADGWTIKHPLSCRPKLFDCRVNRAAEGLTGMPFPGSLGRFEVGLSEQGDQLIIGDRIES